MMSVNESLQSMAKSTLVSNISGAYNSVSKMKSVQATARIAAVLYLVIAVISGVAHGYVPSKLIVPGDAATTASNIMASPALLHVGGVGSELVILLSEIVVTVLLYVLLKPVNRTLSLLAVAFRLVMTAIHAINLLNYFFALQLLGGAGYLTVFGADQLQAMAMLFLNALHYGFEIGIAFFAVHVFILGYLIFKSGYFPRILGILFTIAAAGYLIDSAGMLLLADYVTTPVFIALPIAIAEIAFPIWLLIKGVNVEQWEKRVLASA